MMTYSHVTNLLFVSLLGALTLSCSNSDEVSPFNQAEEELVTDGSDKTSNPKSQELAQARTDELTNELEGNFVEQGMEEETAEEETIEIADEETIEIAEEEIIEIADEETVEIADEETNEELDETKYPHNDLSKAIAEWGEKDGDYSGFPEFGNDIITASASQPKAYERCVRLVKKLRSKIM